MNTSLFTFIVIGFLAQMIDGSLGMAYGVSSTTFLLGVGVPPALASASVHLAEVFTTAVSGASHWRLGNVNKEIVKKLLIPGVLGGILGAYILTSIPTNIIKPLVSVYLLIMGVVILKKVIGKTDHKTTPISSKKMITLGAIGGLFDAIGGGGWGPIVTTTLVAKGEMPRFTIGSVNLTEFAVTLAESLTFALLLQGVAWNMVAGLLIGGVIAAPLGAYATKKLPARALMGMVGLVIIGLSLRTIYLTFA